MRDKDESRPSEMGELRASKYDIGLLRNIQSVELSRVFDASFSKPFTIQAPIYA